MCAILDANVAGEVFAPHRHPVAEAFFRWMKGRGRLVVGGKQWRELRKNAIAKSWMLQGITAGRVRRVERAVVETRVREMARDPKLTLISDDPHVLALAAVGGARLLYSNDLDLQQDFKNQALTGPPRGRVYTSRPMPGGSRPRPLTNAHKRLLRRTDLCGAPDSSPLPARRTPVRQFPSELPERRTAGPGSTMTSPARQNRHHGTCELMKSLDSSPAICRSEGAATRHSGRGHRSSGLLGAGLESPAGALHTLRGTLPMTPAQQ